MSIMITGANGFIGRHVCELVTDKVRVMRQQSEAPEANDIIIDGLNASTCWEGAFDGVDSIIHLAGAAHSELYNDDDYVSINTKGTLNLAQQAEKSGVKRFVFVSSIGVNGQCSKQGPFSVSSQPKPHNSYACSKLDAEIGLKKLEENTKMEIVIVRPTLVYGPLAPGNFLRLKKLVGKLPILPFGLVQNRRNFIAVQNLADLLVTCAVHPKAAGHTFLASDGETVSMNEFCNAIASGLGKKIVQIPIPPSIMYFGGKLTGKSAIVEQLIGDLEVDSSNASKVLDWVPPMTMKQAMMSLRDFGVNK